MNPVVASVLDVTLVLAVGLAACRGLGRHSAAHRHMVLAAAVAAATLAPAFELLIPQIPIVERTATASPFSSSAVSTAQFVDTVTVATATPATQNISWAPVLAYVWLLGATVMLASLAVSLVRLGRLVNQSTRLRDGRWPEVAAAVAKAQGVRRPVTILLSAHRSLLVTCGLWRPTIVLPAEADRWTDARQRIVLTHELAHIRRYDAAIQFAAELLRVVHWFNPLVWLACRRLRVESEYACDDRVLEAGVAPTEYASHLLDVARHAAGPTRAWGPAHAIAQPSTLERRVAAMLNDRLNRTLVTGRARSWIVGGMTAASVLLAAADVTTSPEATLPLPHASTIESLAPQPAPALVAPANAMGLQPARAVRPPFITERAAQAAVVPPQQAESAFVGAVVDQSGGAIPGATLTLTRVEGGSRLQTVASANGRFAFRGLGDGQYTLVVSSPGFTRVSSDLTAATGTTIDRVVTLPLGTLEESIVVSCAANQAAWLSPDAWRRGLNQIAQALVPVVSAQGQDVRPVRVGGAVRPPTKVTDVRPVCPPVALPSAGATVRVVARIGVDGSVQDAANVAAPPNATPPGALVDASLAAVRQWKYTPALLNGRPAEVQVTIAVTYQPQ